jgi:hypothetical protein
MIEENKIFTDEGWEEFLEYLDFLPEEQRSEYMEKFVKFICSLII